MGKIQTRIWVSVYDFFSFYLSFSGVYQVAEAQMDPQWQARVEQEYNEAKNTAPP
jgi:hypothetical protein